MKKIAAFIPLLLIMGCNTKEKPVLEYPDFEIGVIADCQYCYCEPSEVRFYKKASGKLQEAVNELNTHTLDYTIHLGDFIDRDFNSFDTLIPIWAGLKSDRYHVLGNHDFKVADSLKPLVFDKMDLKDRYYSIVRNKWRFIVLDGNDLSVHGALTETKKQQTDSLFTLLSKKELPNLKHWNGGLGTEQLQWVENELKQATDKKERVGFYCHFPALGETNDHNLWNYEQLLAIIDKYDCVKFYFNGHNHAGSYVQKDGVHYLNFKGMLDTRDSTSFARVTFHNDSLLVKGYGREPDRGLRIR
ncbi:metallophosphoesterase [Maribacter sp. ANRC-HE7]|uniref:Metallophosphoesterase n=1 Tax=Maribacter aquimaris TaxID=2737171 RepID=A0ABR7V1B9_9FLAO|nr:metallophosphoesterase [Maribacter aquimaris]MBD0777709.1 metallophosphoesterase [Maribacter aquimaris]